MGHAYDTLGPPPLDRLQCLDVSNILGVPKAGTILKNRSDMSGEKCQHELRVMADCSFFRRRLRAEGAKPKSNKRWKTGLGHVCMYVCMYVCIFVCFSHISHNLQRILSSNQYRSLAH